MKRLTTDGDWRFGMVMGTDGLRGFKVFRPAGLDPAERLPLLVMLHGCGQDARSFAASTCMNAVATRERFVVLYPEQSRLFNFQGCWHGSHAAPELLAKDEAQMIVQAIDQVCLLYPADRARVAVAGYSSGARMAAMLVMQFPGRFKAVVMHASEASGSQPCIRQVSLRSELSPKYLSPAPGQSKPLPDEVAGLAECRPPPLLPPDRVAALSISGLPGPASSQRTWDFAARHCCA